MRTIAAATLLLVMGAPGLQAQNDARAPVVAVLQSGPRVGSRAPDFTLPWASRDGVGPAESPYQLWRDLGKPVVLMFFPRAFTKSSMAQMQTLAAQYDNLFGPDVVVVGISTDSLETLSRFAARAGIPFRLLSDETQLAAKKYGSSTSGDASRRAAFVIRPDGKVAYRKLGFDPLDQRFYAELGAAVRAVKAAPGQAE